MKVTYDKKLTGLLLIDPYNDFISDGGKVWEWLRSSYAADSQRCAESGTSRLLRFASSLPSR